MGNKSNRNKASTNQFQIETTNSHAVNPNTRQMKNFFTKPCGIISNIKSYYKKKKAQRQAIISCNQGWDLLILKNYPAALELFNKAIELRPNYVDAYHNRGISLCLLDKPEEGLNSYNKAIELNPTNANTFYLKGLALNILNRKEQALEALNEAIELDPSMGEAHSMKGNILVYF